MKDRDAESDGHAETEHGEIDSALGLFFDQPNQLVGAGRPDIEVSIGAKNHSIHATGDEVVSRHLIRQCDAVAAIDMVRSVHGLGAYSGGTSESELIDEVLHQRRYSLFGEGHRWIDMRRYNKLGDLPIDRAEDDVWDAFPRPLTEGDE